MPQDSSIAIVSIVWINAEFLKNADGDYGDNLEASTTTIDHIEAELDEPIRRSNRLRQPTLKTSFAGQL